MGDERALAAIARIERAMARIEGAASRPPAAADPDESLRASHSALQAKVGEAIAQIDRLLAASPQEER